MGQKYGNNNIKVSEDGSANDYITIDGWHDAGVDKNIVNGYETFVSVEKI